MTELLLMVLCTGYTELFIGSAFPADPNLKKNIGAPSPNNTYLSIYMCCRYGLVRITLEIEEYSNRSKYM